MSAGRRLRVPRPGQGRHRLPARFAALTLAVGVTATCGWPAETLLPGTGSPTPLFLVGSCPALVPLTLPSGADPGTPRREGPGRVAWGGGSDLVTLAVNEFALGDPASFGVPANSDQWVVVRGARGLVVPVGDDGVGQVAITWALSDCPYTMWLAPGHTVEDGIRYAPQF